MGEKWPATLTQDALNKLCPFKDVKVHQAFIYGMDRFTIADKLLYGKGKVVAGYWPNSQYEDKTLEPYDPEKAKSPLDEAGYKPGADGIRVGTCGGKEVRWADRHGVEHPYYASRRPRYPRQPAANAQSADLAALSAPSRSVAGRDCAGLVVLFILIGSRLVVILVIGATSWTFQARIIRANILSLRERDYVAAARALGASSISILLRHLLPNTMAPIIVSATLDLVNAISSEAYVSFLGLGVQDPPTASWGNMISQSFSLMQRTPLVWWMWVFPSALITFTVLCVNFVGDGLRDALDLRR